MTYQELEKYCKIIEEIAGPRIEAEKDATSDIISDYYSKSSFFYRKFHSAEGAMHLPIEYSREEKHKDKLKYQANYVHDAIQKHEAKSVLELGCGMGFNSNYLSQKNPNTNFKALDLTPSNIAFANSQKEGRTNIVFQEMNYDQLDLADQKFDLIFAVRLQFLLATI